MATFSQNLSVTAAAGSAGPGPSASSAFATIDFGAKTGQSIDPTLYGVCWGAPNDNNFAALADANFRSAAAALPFSLHRLNGDGGGYTEAVFGTGTTANWSYFNNFFQYGAQVIPSGSRLIVGIGSNITRWSVSQYANICGQFVRKFKQSFAVPVWGWEIGNESVGFGSKGIDINTYNSYYNAAAAQIKTDDPNAKVIGPIPNYFSQPDIQTWLQNCTGFADVICWHDYKGCSLGLGANASSVMGYQSNWQSNVASARSMANAVGIADPLCFNGEWNMDGCDITDNPTDVKGAVFAANACLSMANGGTNNMMSAVWELYQDTSFGMIGSQALGGYNVSPMGYFLSKAGQVFGGSRVSATVSGTGLTCLATTKGTNFAAMVINAGSTQSGQVALSRWPLNATGNSPITMWRISGSSPTTSTVTATAGMLPSMSFPGTSVTIFHS